MLDCGETVGRSREGEQWPNVTNTQENKREGEYGGEDLGQ